MTMTHGAADMGTCLVRLNPIIDLVMLDDLAKINVGPNHSIVRQLR